jgi:hypothetical protein
MKGFSFEVQLSHFSDVLWPALYLVACLAMLFGDRALGVVLGLAAYLAFGSKRWLHG